MSVSAASAEIASRWAMRWAWTEAGGHDVTFFPAQEVLQVHGRRHRPDRLQGPGDAQGLHHRDRQDRAEPDHRHALVLPAPARGRDQARPLPGPAAVHRPALRRRARTRARTPAMTALLQWMTANPVRAFLASGLAALFSMFALPMVAWLPGGIVSLGLLAGGVPIAASATAGA